MPTGTPRPLKLTHQELQAARKHLNSKEQELMRGVFGHEINSLAQLALRTNLPLTQVRQNFSQAYRKVMEAGNVPQAQLQKRLFSVVKRLSPSAEKLSQPEINLLIQWEIQRNIPLHSVYWQSNPELKRLYEAARRKNRSDEPYQGNEPGFYGYGDWYEYLQKMHGVSAIRNVEYEGTEYKRKPYYHGELEATIRKELQRHPAHLKYWTSNPSLKQLYDAAYKTGSRGHPAETTSDRFLGYGDWYALLEKKFGIIPVRQIDIEGRKYTRGYLPAELVYLINKEIQPGAKPTYREWQRKPELRRLLYAAEERDADGKVIPRHAKDAKTEDGRKRKGYFGHGRFDAMITAISERRLTPKNWL